MNQENNTIYCQCFGIGFFEGDHCETKTSKQIIDENTVKTSTIVAILVLISLAILIVYFDIHKYCLCRHDKLKRLDRKKQLEKEKEKPKPKPKATKLYYTTP
jgi:hypothetical protein